jgi:RNAse (barnase) inhibitor barstar
MKKYTIDFRGIQYYAEVHWTIKDAIDFPDYYGENWDAFWDCITDKVGFEHMHIEIIGLDYVERMFDGTAEMMITILRRAKHWCDDRFCDITKIEIVDGDKRIEIQ